MKNRLANFIKYNRFIYNIYYYLLNGGIALLKLFIKTDDRLILFNSFGGRKYDDSPKEIYVRMSKDPRFFGYTFVWAFHDPTKFSVEGATVIKTDSLKYFITAIKSKVWVTNSSVERGLNFKNNNTLYFNTWHGTPIKKMGSDLPKRNKAFASKGETSFNVMCAQGDFEVDIFSRVFNIPEKNFLKCGYPRNDVLAKFTEKSVNEIKEKIGIDRRKKVILYAPTFREYNSSLIGGCNFAPPMNLTKWQEKLGDEYCLLFRAHYEVARVMEIKENDFIKDMTSYPSLADLMIISDILISDYSSIFFDFSIMDKIMLHFTYDYDRYSKERGMYFDIRDYLSGSNKEDELIELIKSIKYNEEIKKTVEFRNSFVNYYGDAVQQSVDYIYKAIGGCNE